MKNIAIAAVAASIISTSAIAAPEPVTFTGHATTGAECSAQFDDLGGINVKELSERRQCLAVVHGIDTMFTYKTFWVRNGNTFTAFDVETLGKMNRAERIDYIGLAVQQGALIEMLTEQRDALLAKRNELLALLAVKPTEVIVEIPVIQERIVEVEKIIEVVREVEVEVEVEVIREVEVERIVYEDRIEYRDNEFTVTLNGFYGGNAGEFNTGSLTLTVDQDSTITSLDLSNLLREHYNKGWNDQEDVLYQAIIDALDLQGVTIDSGLETIIQAIVEQGLSNITDLPTVEGLRSDARDAYDSSRAEVDLTVADIDGFKIITVARPDGSPARTLIDDTSIGATGKKSTRTETGNARFKPTQGTLDTSNNAGLTAAASRVVSIEEYDDQSGLSEYTSVDGYFASITIDSRDDKSVPIYNSAGELVDGVYQIDTDHFVNESISDFNSFATQLADRVYDAAYADGFAAGYDEGFEDGYESGYADGYHDGYHDGVASVGN